MKVIHLLCVFGITCVSYGQEDKRVVSEEMKKEEEENSEDKKIGEESLIEKEPIREDLDLWKLNNNETLIIKLDNDFVVQEGTRLERIVVPDLPEEAVDLEYQSQNIFENKNNVTLAESTIVNKSSITTKDEISSTIANLDQETETTTLEPESKEKYDKYLNSELKYILDITTELSTTFNTKRKPSNQVNQILEVSHTTATRRNCTSSKTFPRLDFEIVKRVYTSEDQDNKVKRSSVYEPTLQKFERKPLNSWNSFDFEKEKPGSIVKITKEVPYPVPYPVEKKVLFPVKVKFDRPVPIEVPKPFPVTFEKTVFFPIREYIHIPYPVVRKIPYFIQISVDKPFPIHISRPYPVYFEKKVPYPVEKQIPIPINFPVDLHLSICPS